MGKNSQHHRNKVSAIIFLVAGFTSLPAQAWNRIVILNPMISEWTAEILGEQKALQKIVGVSEFSNYPEYLKKVETVGPYPQVQAEKILSLTPDLVLASLEYNRPDQLEQLKKLKLNVVVLPREDFLSMGSWITELGKALDERGGAKDVALRWKTDLQKIGLMSGKKRVFLQIQFQPLITVGRDSFLNAAFAKVGYENIFSKLPQAYPKVSKEAVLEKNPDEVLVLEMVRAGEDREKIKKSWNKSHVRFLSGDDFSRCSLRLLKALKGLSAP